MALTLTGGLRVFWQCPRNFSTSCTLRNMEAQGRMLSKLLSNNLERKIQPTNHKGGPAQLINKNRIGVLNKLYMTNVCEALSFGDFPEIYERGIQITRVSVKDTQRVEVFWLANEHEDPIEMENYLASIAGKVRSMLINGRMKGYMPTIAFQRDMSAVNNMEVLRLLHKVSHEMERLKSMSLEDEVDTSEKQAVPEVAIQEMQMNVFGLPYNKILQKIQEAKVKSYPLQAPVPPSQEEFQESLVSFSEPLAVSINEQHQKKKDLKKFIRQYQKSALNSNLRKTILQDMNFADDFPEEEDEDEDWAYYEEREEEEEEEDEEEEYNER